MKTNFLFFTLNFSSLPQVFSFWGSSTNDFFHSSSSHLKYEHHHEMWAFWIRGKVWMSEINKNVNRKIFCVYFHVSIFNHVCIHKPQASTERELYIFSEFSVIFFLDFLISFETPPEEDRHSFTIKKLEEISFLSEIAFSCDTFN